MSAVISYWNDNLAMILTDRRVTAAWGTWDEQKLYHIGTRKYAYGSCAGVGLEAGIFAVRDSILKELEPASDEADTFIRQYPGLQNHSFESTTDCSMGWRKNGTTAIKPAIMRVSVMSDGSDIQIDKAILKPNMFHVMFPSTHVENPDLVQAFFDKFSFDGDLSWNQSNILSRAVTMFKFIQKDSEIVVSPDCDIGLLLYDHSVDEFSTKYFWKIQW